jgi:CheY-like chemotaxis protein
MSLQVVQKVLARHLTRWGIKYVEVYDGDEVAAALAADADPTTRVGGSDSDTHTRPFDGIIMDVKMARQHGDVTAAQLRAAGCLLPIVCCTANTDAAALAAYTASGDWDAILPKPFRRYGITTNYSDAHEVATL